LGIPQMLQNAYFHYLPLLINYNLYSLEQINSFLMEKKFKYKIELNQLNQFGLLPASFINPLSNLNLNTTLKTAYKIDQFLLVNEAKNLKINHNSLSSGEKLELSIYLRQLDYFKSGPSAKRCVLLFDEPDCHLHPSKIETELVHYIKQNLVGQRNFQVIVTTHNPTTLSFFDKGNECT
jgi:predicted ATP-dependent endonuclease of OLD family